MIIHSKLMKEFDERVRLYSFINFLLLVVNLFHGNFFVLRDFQPDASSKIYIFFKKVE